MEHLQFSFTAAVSVTGVTTFENCAVVSTKVEHICNLWQMCPLLHKQPTEIYAHVH